MYYKGKVMKADAGVAETFAHQNGDVKQSTGMSRDSLISIRFIIEKTQKKSDGWVAFDNQVDQGSETGRHRQHQQVT